MRFLRISIFILMVLVWNESLIAMDCSLLFRFIPGDMIPIRFGSRLSDVTVEIHRHEDIDKVVEILSSKRDSTILKEKIHKSFAGQTCPCTIRLQEFLPDIARDLTNSFPTSESCKANCFNAVMKWHAPETPLEGPLFTSFRKYLSSNSAIELADSDIKILGDIIVVGQGHAAIYVGNGVLWHKPGFGSDLPWTFHNLDSYLKEESLKSTDLKWYRLH